MDERKADKVYGKALLDKDDAFHRDHDEVIRILMGTIEVSLQRHMDVTNGALVSYNNLKSAVRYQVPASKIFRDLSTLWYHGEIPVMKFISQFKGSINLLKIYIPELSDTVVAECLLSILDGEFEQIRKELLYQAVHIEKEIVAGMISLQDYLKGSKETEVVLGTF